jgi:WD40 repeat protein
MIFRDQGRKLLILDWEDRLHEWDLKELREIRSWHGLTNRSTMTVALTPDESWCLMLGRRGSLAPAALRNLVSGKERFGDLRLLDVEDAAFSPDGRLFAGVSSFGGAKLWKTETFEEVPAFLAFDRCAFAVCFSPDGKRLAIGGNQENAASIWDVETRLELLTLEGEATMFWPTAFSPDGNVLGSMNHRGILHLWRAPSWEEIKAAEAVKEASQRL